MEYWNLVLDVFSVALGWWNQIISADPFLLYVFFGLIFANMVTRLFILPFASGMVSGAGSDFVSRRRMDNSNYHISSRDHQKRLPGGF